MKTRTEAEAPEELAGIARRVSSTGRGIGINLVDILLITTYVVTLEVAILAAVQALSAGSCSTSGALAGLTFALVTSVFPFALGVSLLLRFPLDIPLMILIMSFSQLQAEKKY